MSKILICDDNDTFREILQELLQNEGHEVTATTDGKAAQDVLTLRSSYFDLIISDIRMPRMNGIELLHWVARSVKIPVVLMTGFSEVMETQEAFSLGASGFLSKPFELGDLVQIISDVLGSGASRDGADAASPPQAPSSGAKQRTTILRKAAPDHYYPISIEDFVSGREIPFTIFIKLGEDRFVKLGARGEDISLDRIKAYKSKGVSYLYMMKEDFKKYVGLNLSMTKVLDRVPSITPEKKIKFLRHVGEIVAEKVFLEELDRESFDNAHSYMNSAMDIMSDEPTFLDLLDVLNQTSNDLYAHSLAVSIFSVMISRRLGYTSPTTNIKLALGGLLHDVGKKELPPEIVNKPRTVLAQHEVLLLETHPLRGAEILAEIKGIHSDITQIVLQHHENCLGLGYPRGLTKQHIHPLALIVHVANLFATLTVPRTGKERILPMDALQRIEETHAGTFDSAAFIALTKLVLNRPYAV